MGATTIWDAHFFWPYQGMFLPPNATWASNTGGGEELACGAGWRHGDVASRARVAASYASARGAGLRTLAYFNLFHFGQDVEWPLPAPPPPPAAADAWTNSSLFLAANLSASVLAGPEYDWQNSIVLDPANPVRADFLVAQVAEKVSAFGAALEGIVIDELIPSTMINFSPEGAGGGGWATAWCGATCRFLLPGWAAVAARVAGALRADGLRRTMLANFIGAQRIDVLSSADGVFSENYLASRVALTNVVGLATTGKPPAIVWTNSEADITSTPGGADAFFSRHVYMKTFPMAPSLGADHAISDGAPQAVLRAYADWGPIFLALTGACWHLAATPVAVSPPPAIANAFTLGGGCTSPDVESGNGPVAALLLFACLPPQAAPAPVASVVNMSFVAPAGISPTPACEAISPGGAWATLPAPSRGGGDGRWQLQALGLSRGAVLVRCV